MVWVIFVAGAVLSWGAYGALLYMGQTQLGNPLKALLCVGAAYFLLGVLVPMAALGSASFSGFNKTGVMNATIGGALGAARHGFVVGSALEQHRKRPAAGRTIDIGRQPDPVACPDDEIPLDEDIGYSGHIHATSSSSDLRLPAVRILVTPSSLPRPW